MIFEPSEYVRLKSKRGGDVPPQSGPVYYISSVALGLTRFAVKQNGLSLGLRVDQVEMAATGTFYEPVTGVIDKPVPVIPHIWQVENLVRTHAQSPR
jgi:hypothetical protein